MILARVIPPSRSADIQMADSPVVDPSPSGRCSRALRPVGPDRRSDLKRRCVIDV